MEQLGEVIKFESVVPLCDANFGDVIGYITVPVKLGRRPGTKNGSLFMSYADCIGRLKDEDTDHEVGSVGGTIGANYEMRDLRREINTYIDPMDFWKSFQKLMEQIKKLPDQFR